MEEKVDKIVYGLPNSNCIEEGNKVYSNDKVVPGKWKYGLPTKNYKKTESKLLTTEFQLIKTAYISNVCGDYLLCFYNET